MATGRRVRSPRSTAREQDARKAPRMAQGGLSPQGWCPELGDASDAILGNPWSSGDKEGAGRHAGGRVQRAVTRPATAIGGLASKDTAVPSPAWSVSGSCEKEPSNGPPKWQSVAQRTGNLGQHVYRPTPLSIPARAEVDESRIDDIDRHLAARARLRLLVDDLCRKYRREFPAYKYKATTEGSHREMAALLSLYGGLPQVDSLNGVPAEVLEKAVEAFAAYFGLTEAGAGVPAGSGFGAAELDPAPRKRVEVEVAPW